MKTVVRIIITAGFVSGVLYCAFRLIMWECDKIPVVSVVVSDEQVAYSTQREASVSRKELVAYLRSVGLRLTPEGILRYGEQLILVGHCPEAKDYRDCRLVHLTSLESHYRLQEGPTTKLKLKINSKAESQR